MATLSNGNKNGTPSVILFETFETLWMANITLYLHAAATIIYFLI